MKKEIDLTTARGGSGIGSSRGAGEKTDRQQGGRKKLSGSEPHDVRGQGSKQFRGKKREKKLQPHQRKRGKEVVIMWS